ncbi:hypothetical protein FBEOM_4609 [Fusarium beomiforme]|uniref:Uncharacterized protein n=1 Tax=Fusarium beomiforme TaxID=44412 RepID=A0A9P5AMI3_9HYPO|nr:hypothetical protein FBEOM_4609 [Fusarium beomiforme]
MKAKHYLEFSPRGKPGVLFSGQVPPAKEVEKSTHVRRQHMYNYITFLRPEIGHMISEYGRVAIKTVCEQLYAGNVRSTPERWFVLQCDRAMWRACFTPLGDDGPEWPWPNIKYPSKVERGELASGRYAHYCEERRYRDAITERENAAIKPKTEDVEAAQAADPNSQFIVTSQAPLLNTGDPEPIDTDLDMRVRMWDTEIRKPFSECDAVGPFEIEATVPLEWYVTKDLAAINSFLPPGITIKLNITNKSVFVTVVDMFSHQHFVEVWKFLRSWGMMTKSRVGSEPKTLLEHFQGFKEAGGFSWET